MPRKDWLSEVGCGSPRGSLKIEGMKDGGHEIGRHVERRGRKVRKKKKHQRWLVTAGTGVERKILAADSCRGSAAKTMRAS